MQRSVPRIFRPFALAALAAIAPAAGFAADAVDRALVGTWDGSGTILTSSLRKSGKFTLRIEPAGRYILVLRAIDDLAIDWGPWTTSQDKFARTDSTGIEDQGTYRRIGEVFLVSSIFGTFELRPARDKQDMLFQGLDNLMRMPPGPRISDWTARAAAWATLWQPDAALDQIEASRLADDATLAPYSELGITFYSRAVGRFLQLSPSSNGTLTSAVNPRGAREPAPRPIPVPIVDLSEMLRAARAAGFTGRYGSAVLRVVGDTPEQARPQWSANVGGGGLGRQCFDLATRLVTDCAVRSGDATKDYEALAARAAASWAWIQAQWAAGPSEGSSWSLEASEAARCKAASGAYKDAACFAADGRQLFP